VLEKKVLRYLTAVIAGLTAAILLSMAGMITEFENRSYDFRARSMASGPAENSPIRIIYLDQPSLDWAEENFGISWPWNREIYGIILDFLTDAGARAVMFDVLYTEASAYGVSDDARFAAAIARNPSTVIALALTSGDGQAVLPQRLSGGWPVYPEGTSGERYEQVTLPAGDLLPSVTNLANVQLAPDSDGIFRRVQPFADYRGIGVPTLGTAPVLLNGGEFSFVKGRWNLDGRPLPTDSDGNLILRFRGESQSYPSVNAASVIRSYLQKYLENTEPDIDPAFFSDAYVFFGFSAPGLKDLRPSPVAGDYPGVEIHATTLDNFLDDSFIRSPGPALRWLYTVFLIALGALIVYGGTRGVFLYFLLLVPVGAGFAAYAAGAWLPIILPLLGLIVSLVSGSLLNYATEGRQKRFIRQAFSQYLSPAVIQNLLVDPRALQLGGEKRPLSIFFSDLQGLHHHIRIPYPGGPDGALK
jgi:adenylate cyclase